MKKKRIHKTTKNTVQVKNPITRLAVISGECNGKFTIVTDLVKEFDTLYLEWFDHPTTVTWCVESLIIYVKQKYPNSICMKEEDYKKITDGKVVPATKEEYEAENN